MRVTRKSQKSRKKVAWESQVCTSAEKSMWNISLWLFHGSHRKATKKLQKSCKRVTKMSQESHKIVTWKTSRATHGSHMKNACRTHGSPLKLHTNWLHSFFLHRRQHFNVPVGAPCRQGRSYSHFPGSSIRSLLLLPAVHWVHGACTDALARVCPASAPSTDDVGPEDALQPGLLSASWAAPKCRWHRNGHPSYLVWKANNFLFRSP
jgi:hypothetical protein